MSFISKLKKEQLEFELIESMSNLDLSNDINRGKILDLISCIICIDVALNWIERKINPRCYHSIDVLYSLGIILMRHWEIDDEMVMVVNSIIRESGTMLSQISIDQFRHIGRYLRIKDYTKPLEESNIFYFKCSNDFYHEIPKETLLKIPYFRAIFDGGFLEAQQNEMKFPEIDDYILLHLVSLFRNGELLLEDLTSTTIMSIANVLNMWSIDYEHNDVEYILLLKYIASDNIDKKEKILSFCYENNYRHIFYSVINKEIKAYKTQVNV